MLCHINIHIYFSLITHHVWGIQISYLPCGFWSCAICSFYSEQRVFEQYSKTSLVSVAEGFFVVFKGTAELLRVILAKFKNILKSKNIVIFFLKCRNSYCRGRPGSAEVVLRKGSSRFCQLLNSCGVRWSKSKKSRCGLSQAVNFWWPSSCLCLCSEGETDP